MEDPLDYNGLGLYVEDTPSFCMMRFPQSSPNFSHFCATFKNGKFSIVYLTVYLNLIAAIMI